MKHSVKRKDKGSLRSNSFASLPSYSGHWRHSQFGITAIYTETYAETQSPTQQTPNTIPQTHSIMALRRPPTRIELKTEDMAEYDEVCNAALSRIDVRIGIGV